MKDFSFVTNSHPAYIESLYQDYRKDPGAVDPEWGKFFEGIDFAVNNVNGKAGAGAPVTSDQLTKELNVYRLIQAYRKKGHLVSKTNPIRERKDRQANLDISFFRPDRSRPED
jgi:2-oxoglutarate dehydrogenase E1 component